MSDSSGLTVELYNTYVEHTRISCRIYILNTRARIRCGKSVAFLCAATLLIFKTAQVSQLRVVTGALWFSCVCLSSLLQSNARERIKNSDFCGFSQRIFLDFPKKTPFCRLSAKCFRKEQKKEPSKVVSVINEFRVN